MFRPKLELPNIKLQYGNTGQQRRDYITKLIEFNKSIVDIGCGEGFYAIPFAGLLQKKKDTLKYYAIDINDDELKIVKRRSIEEGLKNIVLLSSHEQMKMHCDGVYDVIMTEVVEHMEKEESQTIIKWVLDNIKYNRIIITTPNFDFNVHYNMDTKFRHHDHHWELTQEQFKQYVGETLNSYKDIKVTFLDIGDMVDGSPCTQGIMIEKS
jgi:2-polyprenyl-3-methyl-5-hydroxy-6-metoxy-1,4-benzoquinol methylase